MRFVDIIEKKRDGNPLTTEEIQFFITNYTNGTIPDYQVSALLMAIYYQGMTSKECADLTTAMMYSGDTVDLSSIQGIKVDKHSTGGVGDTTTLVLAPLVAAVGVSVIGQSGNLTPADKKLYSLRDVTGTVNSIPLIASSIMSKKLAAGADAIVLDVKTGDGALMREMADSEKLANEMVKIGNQIGRRTMAIISDMSQPLGYAIGNALEVKEAIDTLKGQGPADLTELVLTLGSQMVVLADKAKTLDEARIKLQEAINNGKAIEKFKTLIEAQGGDSTVVDHPEKLASAPYQIALPALKSGYVSRIVADQIGIIAMQLGAGRATKEDVIDPAVGIVLHKKVGDKVEQGEALLTIHASTDKLDAIKQKLYDNITISDNAHEPTLIYKVITE